MKREQLDGTVQDEVTLTGRNVPAVITQLMNAVSIPASGTSIINFDITYAGEIQLWIAATSTYSLTAYPKYTIGSDDTNLTTVSIGLASSVAAPAANRSASYKLNAQTNPFSPAKTMRLLINNNDAVNPNTITLWVATRGT